MATVKHVKLYFYTCASHMYKPFKEDFVTLNEDHTDRTLNSIASGITIWGTGTFKYVMLDDAGKPYTMILESYWVPELKHWFISPQDIHTEDGNPMLLQTHSWFEVEGIFA